MADDSGSSTILGVIVGVLIIGAVLFFVFGDGFPRGGGGGGPGVDVSVDAPAVPAPATPSPGG